MGFFKSITKPFKKIFKSTGKIAGPVMTGLGIATGNPALLGAGIATSGLASAFSGSPALSAAAKYYKRTGDIAALQYGIMADQWKRYKQIYDPLEKELAKSRLQDIKVYEKYQPVKKYFSLVAEDLSPKVLAGRAAADIEQSFAQQKGQLARNLGRLGLGNRLASMLGDLSREAALAKAGARTKAYTLAKDINLNRLGQAINVGRGMAASTTIPSASGIISGLGSAARTFSNLGGLATQFGSQSAMSGLSGIFQGLGMMAPTIKNWLFKPSTPSGTVMFGGSDIPAGISIGLGSVPIDTTSSSFSFGTGGGGGTSWWSFL